MNADASTDIVYAGVNRAVAMLAEARSAVEAKRVADMAAAAAVYGRRQQAAKEAIEHATAIMVDALARMGEFLKVADMAPAGRPPKIPTAEEGISRPPTLAEVGISYKESSQAQALATLKADKPEEFAAIRGGDKPVSAAPAAVRGETVKPAAERLVKPASKPEPSKPAPPPDGAWAEFVARMEGVAEFARTVNPKTAPEDMESWQLLKLLDSTSRALLIMATRVRQSR